MLVTSVIKKISRDSKLQQSIVIYFFVDERFNNPNRMHSVAILHSFVYQLSYSLNISDNDIIEKTFHASAQELSLKFEVLWDIFSALLSLNHNIIIVLDELDESNDSNIESLMSNLLNIIS